MSSPTGQNSYTVNTQPINHWTSIARTVGTVFRNYGFDLVNLSRTTGSTRPIFDPCKVKIGLCLHIYNGGLGKSVTKQKMSSDRIAGSTCKNHRSTVALDLLATIVNI